MCLEAIFGRHMKRNIRCKKKIFQTKRKEKMLRQKRNRKIAKEKK